MCILTWTKRLSAIGFKVIGLFFDRLLFSSSHAQEPVEQPDWNYKWKVDRRSPREDASLVTAEVAENVERPEPCHAQDSPNKRDSQYADHERPFGLGFWFPEHAYTPSLGGKLAVAARTFSGCHKDLGLSSLPSDVETVSDDSPNSAKRKNAYAPNSVITVEPRRRHLSALTVKVCDIRKHEPSGPISHKISDDRIGSNPCDRVRVSHRGRLPISAGNLFDHKPRSAMCCRSAYAISSPFYVKSF